MDEQIVTFDTMTVGAYLDGSDGAPEPAIGGPGLERLASLPRLAAPSAPGGARRIDQPTEAPTGLHGVGDTHTVVSAAAAAQPASQALGHDRVRLDTLHTASPATAAPESIAPPVVGVDDELTGWLMQAEAAVLPYSRWIVLAAIVAALGLTMVLLQGGAPPANEYESASESGVVVIETFSDPAAATVAGTETAPVEDSGYDGWPTVPEESDGAAIAPAPQLTARGPISSPAVAEAAATPRHAVLSGEVIAPGATGVEPIEVASRPLPSPYPSTARPSQADDTGSWR